MGIADGGSGGDPLNNAQNLSSAFGKMMRIDPLGKNSANGKYGIPKDNPFVNDNDPNTLGEIYAFGLRNPQRFAWDSRNGNMFVADIGQNIVEEVSQMTAGRESRVEQVGGQLRLHQPAGRQPRKPARRSEDDLSRSPSTASSTRCCSRSPR